jgi:hypothetical protein
LKEEGKSEVEIEQKIIASRRRNTKSFRNKSIRRSEDIIWDPSQHTFPLQAKGKAQEENEPSAPDPVQTVTVAEYFRLRYKMTLRFPKMPLVFLTEGKEKGWFPIEFLYQAWGKVKATDHNQDVLKFNDHFASTARIEHLKTIKSLVDEIKSKSAPEFTMLLQQLNLTTNLQPEQLTATVLPQPIVKFQAGNDKVPSDGSWNLANVKFPKPAFMSSFAIVDFANFSRNEYDRPRAFEKLFQVMGNHGIEMPRNEDIIQTIRNIIVQVDGSLNQDIVSLSGAS